MTPEFWITTLAIVIGPIIAVVIAHFLQKRQESRQRKLSVFRMLMTTRRAPLSPERVQALNLVEVEFHGDREVGAKFRTLIELYNDTLRWKSQDPEIQKKILQDTDDRSAELLQCMGKVLGFKLTDLDLLRGGYSPEAFTILEAQQAEIRDFLVGLKTGSLMVPVGVIDVRHPQQVLEEAQQKQLLIEHAKNLETETQRATNVGGKEALK